VRKASPLTPAYRIYAALTAIAAPLIHSQSVKKMRQKGVADQRAEERLGKASVKRADGDLIWFHAVSVGELQSILSLLAILRQTRPEAILLITTTTTTSADLASKRLPYGCLHQFSPLDTPKAVNAFLNHWQPSLAVFVESELWPRQIVSLSKRDIPIALINARLSAKSLKNWNKFPKSAKMILSELDLVLSQTDATAKDLIYLGAQAERVHTTGDMKKAAAPLPVDQVALSALQSQIADRFSWLAASTHNGEDGIIAEAHLAVLEASPQALLVLVPRHPERSDAIGKDLNDRGLTVARRSKGEAIDPTTQVYLADTLGELGTFFSLCPIAFIGGSFTPVGGHNPYEPAHFDCAILHGPLYANFQTAYADMHAQDACLEVASPEDLARKVIELIASKDCAQLQSAAKSYIREGAKTPEIVEQFLTKIFKNEALPTKRA
jgi:3-deoxy-D-manno-octulosonic-acid transferase